MDFFEQQDQAKGRTKVLVLLFGLSILLLTAGMYLSLASVICYYLEWHAFGTNTPSMWNPQLLLWVVLGNGLVIGLGSLFKIIELRGGGNHVAEMLGGRLIHAETDDPKERQLMNVVEEMAIASGVPMPMVYLLKDTSINAFAAGHSPSNAVIGVTTGCMHLLTRDELQAVMAHEFSHILNGDMRLNIRTTGILHGIVSIAVIGRILCEIGFSADSDNENDPRGPLVGIGVLGLVIAAFGAIGVYLGRCIKSAISHQREYLADAAAVQFTRNPQAMAGALKKIGGLSRHGLLSNPHTEEASHMFFERGLAFDFGEFMSTHPPLETRVARIDPYFEGEFPEIAPLEQHRIAADGVSEKKETEDASSDFMKSAMMAGMMMGGARMSWNPNTVTNAASQPGQAQLQYAADLRESLAPELRKAAHDPLGAQALMFAMLLADEDALFDEQIEGLKTHCVEAIISETRILHPKATGLDPRAKLPLVDMAIPSLRQLSREQYASFQETLQWLVESDQQIDLFEYTLSKVLDRHLKNHFEPSAKPRIKYHSIIPLLPRCSTILSGFAHIGHEDTASTEHAFRQGAACLKELGKNLKLLPYSKCNLGEMDTAVAELGQAPTPLRMQVVNALAHTVGADGEVTVKEAELLRAFADMLDCPIPPFVQSSKELSCDQALVDHSEIEKQ